MNVFEIVSGADEEGGDQSGQLELEERLRELELDYGLLDEESDVEGFSRFKAARRALMKEFRRQGKRQNNGAVEIRMRDSLEREWHWRRSGTVVDSDGEEVHVGARYWLRATVKDSATCDSSPTSAVSVTKATLESV